MRCWKPLNVTLHWCTGSVKMFFLKNRFGKNVENHICFYSLITIISAIKVQQDARRLLGDDL
jgi:hypothetical protein